MSSNLVNNIRISNTYCPEEKKKAEWYLKDNTENRNNLLEILNYQLQGARESTVHEQ